MCKSMWIGVSVCVGLVCADGAPRTRSFILVKIKLQQHQLLYLCLKWKQWQWLFPCAMCHAALFYRCVLLNAFKELFAAKYLSLHFSSFPCTSTIYICMAKLIALCLALHSHTLKFISFVASHLPPQSNMFHSIYTQHTLSNFYYSRYFIALAPFVNHILPLIPFSAL